MVSINRLDSAKRVQVVKCLVEGNSIRATVRMTGVAKNTITKLLVDLGRACAEYQDEHLRNLPCKRVQCDEIWSFIGAKQKNIKTVEQAESGGVMSGHGRPSMRIPNWFRAGWLVSADTAMPSSSLAIWQAVFGTGCNSPRTVTSRT